MTEERRPLRQYISFAERNTFTTYKARKADKMYDVWKRHMEAPPRSKHPRCLTFMGWTVDGFYKFEDVTIYTIVHELGDIPGMKEVIAGSNIYGARKPCKMLRRRSVAAILNAWGWELR